MRKPTSTEKSIAKALGVTPAGLALLCRAAAHKDGWAGGGIASLPLDRAGLIVHKIIQPPPHIPGGLPVFTNVITPAGRELVAKARKMGF